MSLSYIILSDFFIGFSPQSFITLVVLCLLLLCSALISGSETGFFSLQPSDIDELENDSRTSARTAIEVRRNPKKLLATILICNNLVNVTIIMLSNSLMASMFNFESNKVLAFVVQVIVVTSLILIFGEIVPKIYATKRPLKIVLLMSRALKVLETIFKPLSNILVKSTSFIDKRLERKVSHNISAKDLSTVIDISTDDAPFEEKKMLKGIASFYDKTANEIMKPRIDIFAVEINLRFRAMLDMVIQNGFSRIPVYRETLDNVVGILYVKDLLEHLNDKDDYVWQNSIQPVKFVPEQKKINVLFQEFRDEKVHIAIVVDEYGGTLGMLTMEDVLEEIVGDIKDEFDEEKEEKYYTKISENVFKFKAQTNLVDFCRTFNLDKDYFSNFGESDTLAGLILEMEGRIPEEGWLKPINDFDFQIAKVDSKHIIDIIVKRHSPDADNQ